MSFTRRVVIPVAFALALALGTSCMDTDTPVDRSLVNAMRTRPDLVKGGR